MNEFLTFRDYNLSQSDRSCFCASLEGRFSDNVESLTIKETGRAISGQFHSSEMKSFTVFLVLAVTLCAVIEQSSCSKELIKLLGKKCIKDENASEDDVDLLSEGKLPTTPEGKCFMACMAEQFGMVMLVVLS
jgi:PBP/GOBP family